MSFSYDRPLADSYGPCTLAGPEYRPGQGVVWQVICSDGIKRTFDEDGVQIGVLASEDERIILRNPLSPATRMGCLVMALAGIAGLFWMLWR